MINVRKGTDKDIEAAWKLVVELAIYEKAENDVEVSVDEMRKNFSEGLFDFFVAEYERKIVGMALYYYKYSTWKGKCIYLDDIVVTEKYRNMGIGYELMKALIKLAGEEGVRKLEWQVLKWNVSAIEFYKKLDVWLDDEWLNCKMTHSEINK